MEVEPLPSSQRSIQVGGQPGGTVVYVDVLFGPPEISLPDGTTSLEPPERVLAADRILQLPTSCGHLVEEERTPVEGRVRLGVSSSGQTQIREVVRGTGDPCADEVMIAVADALEYRWLPNERYPPPVDLVQPVTLMAARD
jgi:hypothetical protein